MHSQRVSNVIELNVGRAVFGVRLEQRIDACDSIIGVIYFFLVVNFH